MELDENDFMCFIGYAVVLLITFLIIITAIYILFEGAEISLSFYRGVVTGWGLGCMPYMFLTILRERRKIKKS